MGVEKVRRAFAVKGPLTIGGDTKFERSSANVLDLDSTDKLRIRSGTLFLGTDVAFTRKAANRAGLATGDVLDQSGTEHSLRVPDADAYPTLANDGEIVVVSALPGTARIYWRALGTTYSVDAS